MNERDASPIGFFQKYLTVWVILCMAVGICVGKFLPQIPEFLNRFEYARVSIPMAILIWVMIYPMMMKVDFRSIKNAGRNPKGLFVTWIVNWLIKPFTMYGMARATSTGTAFTASARLSLHPTQMVWRRPSRMWNGNSTRAGTRPLSKVRTGATPRSGTRSATAPFSTCCPAARPARRRASTNLERWMNTLRRRIC